MTAKGTPFWAAPELLSGKRFREHADTFSFGVVLYEIAVRHVPYEALMQDKKGRGFVMKLAKKSAEGSFDPSSKATLRAKSMALAGLSDDVGCLRFILVLFFCLVLFLPCLGLAVSAPFSASIAS